MARARDVLCLRRVGGRRSRRPSGRRASRRGDSGAGASAVRSGPATQRPRHPHRRPALGRARRGSARDGEGRRCSPGARRRTWTASPPRARGSPTPSCTTSLCSPSRASLLSGRYAQRHKVLNNFTEYPNDLPSYPRRLQDAGYETAYIGKWHMGEDNDAQRPGFDYWMSHKGQGNYFDNEFNIDGTRKPIKGYYTTVVTDHAVEWIKRSRTRSRGCSSSARRRRTAGRSSRSRRYEKAFDALPVRTPVNYGDYRAADGKPAWLEQSLATWHGAQRAALRAEGARQVRPGLPRARCCRWTTASAGSYEALRGVRAARRHADRLHQRQRLRARRARPRRQADDVRGEHPRADAGALPAAGRRPARSVDGWCSATTLRRALLDALRRRSRWPNVDGRSWKPLLRGQARRLADGVLLRVQLRDAVPVHAERARRADRPTGSTSATRTATASPIATGRVVRPRSRIRTRCGT